MKPCCALSVVWWLRHQCTLWDSSLCRFAEWTVWWAVSALPVDRSPQRRQKVFWQKHRKEQGTDWPVEKWQLLVSHWILTSCQPHRITSGQKWQMTVKRFPKLKTNEQRKRKPQLTPWWHKSSNNLRSLQVFHLHWNCRQLLKHFLRKKQVTHW